MKTKGTTFGNIIELMEYFKTKEDCVKYMEKMIWGSSVPLGCPKCGNTKTYSFKDNYTHKCAACKSKFNVLTNTVFENTKIHLKKWITCIYIASSHKRGVSSVQLSKLIGVTQKTAWFMIQRIRVAYANLKPTSLEGKCTADETFVGGKGKNKHYDKKNKQTFGRGHSDKINVFGILQIGGSVVSQSVPTVGKYVLRPIIDKIVKPMSILMTDEWHGYSGLKDNYFHITTDHVKYQYVNKENGATTNAIENYWSHVKRAVIGTYYHVSKKHIDRYLAEFDYKFNTRNQNDSERFNDVLMSSFGRLKYKQLIAA